MLGGSEKVKKVTFGNKKPTINKNSKTKNQVASASRISRKARDSFRSSEPVTWKNVSDQDDAVSILLEKAYKLKANLLKFSRENDDDTTDLLPIHNKNVYGWQPSENPEYLNANLDEAVVEFVLDPEVNYEHEPYSDDSYVPSADDPLSDVDDPLHDDSILKQLFYSDEGVHDQLNLGKMNEGKRYGGRGLSRLKQLTKERIAFLKKVRFIRIFIDSLRLSPNVQLPREDNFNKRKYYLMFEFVKPTTTGRSKQVSVSADAVKVPAKIVISNELQFGHRSVFPWEMGNTSQCQGFLVNFTLYHKFAKNAKLDLIGSGHFNLDHIVCATAAQDEEYVEIHSKMSVCNAIGLSFGQASELSTNILGKLKLKIDFISTGKVAKVATDASTHLAPYVEKQAFEIADLGLKTFKENQTEVKRQGPNKELFPDNSAKDIIMQCLLSVSEGKFNVSGNLKIAPGGNLRLRCRLFWSQETVQSDVCWSTDERIVFKFVCVLPVALSVELLGRTQNNFMIIEILRKYATPYKDEIFGICKLPLHLFYLYFCDKNIMKSLLQSQHSIIAVDDWIPALNLFNGNVIGSLKVLLAVGTYQQICALKQRSIEGPKMNEFRSDHTHKFEISITGCNSLSLPEDSVWGECDCYVQYLFPATQDSKPGKLRLEAHFTAPKLCRPDFKMNYVKKHSITLPSLEDLRHTLLKAFSRTGMIFQLWFKYYFPAEQECVFAEAQLPIGKLIEVFNSSEKSADFHLPLIYTDADLNLYAAKENIGKLHVTVKYSESSQQETANKNENMGDDAARRTKGKGVQTDLPSSESATVTCDDQVPQKLPSTGEHIYCEGTDSDRLLKCESTFSALLIVERGSGITTNGGGKQNTVVCYKPIGDSEVVKSDVRNSRNPEWNFRVETELPYSLLSDRKGVILKVACTDDSSVEGYEQLIGFSAVDISALTAGLQQIHGWYNVINLQGECKGQILVLVQPLRELRYGTVPPSSGDDNSGDTCVDEFSACATYRTFPSHISRFTEQRITAISTGPSNCIGAISDDSSKSFLADCLRKNLGELDAMQKYLSEKFRENYGGNGTYTNNLSNGTTERCFATEECRSEESVIDNNIAAVTLTPNAKKSRQQPAESRREKSRLAAAIFH